MVNKHHSFIARQVGEDAELVRDFDGMYRAVDDPHGQRGSAENAAHELYIQIIGQIYDRLLGPKISKPLRYVDVGCGLGYFTDRIVELLRSKDQNLDAHAVDISETAVAKAAEHSQQPISFSVGSLLQRSSLESLGTFDLVTCFETLYYFTDEEWSQIVDNLTQLVRADRYVVVSYHLPERMSYGRYIQGLKDVRRWFPEFSPVWEMDFVDNISTIYDGAPFGRHLFAALQRNNHE